MTQTAARVTAPSAEAANLLKLVATYCGVQDSVVISVAPTAGDVEFSVDGAPAFGLNSACRYIASFSPAAAQLLGQTPEQQAKVRRRQARQQAGRQRPHVGHVACPCARPPAAHRASSPAACATH